MMKKVLIAGVALATLLVAFVVIAVVAFTFVRPAFAQSEATPEVPFGPGRMWRDSSAVPSIAGRGMMGARGRMGGMHGWQGQAGYGPMHEYMSTAMAEALGVTPEELQAAHEAGKTAWDIAQEKGWTQEQFVERMTEAKGKALAGAVEAGVITQAQADFMLERMGTMWENGMGAGGCRGGRWNTQPATP